MKKYKITKIHRYNISIATKKAMNRPEIKDLLKKRVRIKGYHRKQGGRDEKRS